MPPVVPKSTGCERLLESRGTDKRAPTTSFRLYPVNLFDLIELAEEEFVGSLHQRFFVAIVPKEQRVSPSGVQLAVGWDLS